MKGYFYINYVSNRSRNRTRNTTRLCLQPSCGFVLGIGSSIVSSRMIDIWVAASVGLCSCASSSVSRFMEVSLVTVEVATTRLVATPAALGLECTIDSSLFGRDRDGISDHGS